jgi:D-aminoacyl-tRNA deacylase
MFAELGSSSTQWNDLNAAEAVAHAAMEAVSRFGEPSDKAVLGIGGPHYNMKFTRMALEDNVAFGHMIPKYAISGISTEVLQQCLERTLERTEFAALDWKGIKGEDKPRLFEMLKEVGVPLEKV